MVVAIAAGIVGGTHYETTVLGRSRRLVVGIVQCIIVVILVLQVHNYMVLSLLWIGRCSLNCNFPFRNCYVLYCGVWFLRSTHFFRSLCLHALPS